MSRGGGKERKGERQMETPEARYLSPISLAQVKLDLDTYHYTAESIRFPLSNLVDGVCLKNCSLPDTMHVLYRQ